jgi:hypothetical protein
MDVRLSQVIGAEKNYFIDIDPTIMGGRIHRGS